ncbi:MAG: lamin tail domain-containing protein [Akkermansiaceae bacterium]
MKKLTLTLLPFTAIFSMGDLVVTEVMSSSRHLDTSINGDWWELTNNGSTGVNLSGYSWDDDSNLAGQQSFPSYNIQPGESVVLLNEGTTSAIAPFRAAWGLSTSVKIFVASDFGSFPGFSGGSGDTINVFQPNGVRIDSFTFGPATSGSSFSNFENGNPIPGGISEFGVFNASASTENPSDIGSPGIAPAVPPPVSPSFEAPLEIHWPAGQDSSSLEILPTAVDPNPGDVITLSVIAKPDWLTITFPGNGVINFSGTPTNDDIGAHPFTLIAIDNSNVTAATEQDFTFHVLPQTSPIILNEYNAVAENFFLDGAAEGEAAAPTDVNLGQIQGNGGEWMEFVITGDGSSPVDLRRHTIEIRSNSGQHTVKLSDHPALSELIPGTILTLSAEFPTHLNKQSQLSVTNGANFVWSNIWLYDRILIDQDDSLLALDPVINDLNTRVRILNASDEVIYGPSGESVAAADTNNNSIPDTLVAIPDTEVFKLEQNPTSSINPLFAIYNDGSSSTYGAPNTWSGGTQSQSFAAFSQTNSPPTLSLRPVGICVRGVYNSAILFTDPNGQSVTITASGVPSFLTFTDGGNGSASLVNNRPITAADIGTYDITITADDGQAAFNKAYHAFQLTVYNPAPEVILNEYNAVSDDLHLNGGDINFDKDGRSTTRDPFFGRALGNGGDWFELAVVGDGGPTLVDMRGWTIEIGEGKDGGSFEDGATVTLSQDEYWAAVPSGTILTFIVNDTASGGLDTDLDRVDEFSTQGWSWSNINLGDSSMVTVTGVIDIDSTRTQFIISDTEKVHFGPVGEGILEGVSVSNEEIFALEASPRPTTSMFDNGDLVQGGGYDDGRIDSTFGSRNRYLPNAETQVKVLQDFTPFILQNTSFSAWSQQFGDVGPTDENRDADSDQWTNLEEYLFGSDPTDGSSTPEISVIPETESISFTIRLNDSAYDYQGERSGDLQSWVDTELTELLTPSPLGAPFGKYTVSYNGDAEQQFFRIRVVNE